LDEILEGRLVPHQAYLVRGGPGTGKTTLGLHFLMAGAQAGETALFITLGEPEEQIRLHATSRGFDLHGITFLDLSPSPEFFTEVEAYDIFSPSEVERGPTTQRIVEQIEMLKPVRVFIDSMTQFRYLASDAFQFRKQTLSFLRYLVAAGATVVLTSEDSDEISDDDLQFLSDGIIHLTFSGRNRMLAISKFRGSDFQSGQHTLRLGPDGIEVFPILLPKTRLEDLTYTKISSGVPQLDEMLHGGLERNTITIITGPSGVGKTSLGLQFIKEAAGRGERSVVYLFEEARDALLHRSESINIPVKAMIERGTLAVKKIDPLQYTPDEFAYQVRYEAEELGTQIVMIDSVAGYRLSVRGQDLVGHLHALAKYLSNVGVTVVLINEVENITGEFQATEVGISYLADNLIFLRYLEIQGSMRKAVGVLKKRLSDFERHLREYEITRYGIKIGEPLVHLRGILSGRPEWAVPVEKDPR
jgi:circadian clock protein KaiC